MSKKAKLSKTLLQMKFMKRTKEAVEKEEDDEQGRAMYSNEITDKMLSGQSYYILEPSYTVCETLIEGRVSFRGANEEIERLIQSEYEARRGAIEHVKEREISDEKMAQHYTNLVKTIGKKFENKRRRRGGAGFGGSPSSTVLSGQMIKRVGRAKLSEAGGAAIKRHS